MYVSDLQCPRVFVIVGDAHAIVVGDHVVVNGQDGFRVRFDPGHLNILELFFEKA